MSAEDSAHKPSRMLIGPCCRYMVAGRQDHQRLASLPLQQFVRSVGARTAAPGGGSVSAAIAAMVRMQVWWAMFIRASLVNVNS